MTREEALEQLRIGPGINEDVSEEYNNAVDMAIKALEKDTDKEMFDDWHEAPSYAMTLEQAREAVHELRKEIVKLRKEPCEDAVSRQAVLKEIPVLWNGNGDKDYCMESLRDFVIELPPVTTTRKVGKWIYTPHKRLVDETEEGPVYEVQEKCSCSACGADFGYCKVDDNYCKYCGAEMESEDGSN